MQTKKVKIITVSPDGRKKLAALHNCSQATVWSALAYKSYSTRAANIRNDAKTMFGGVEHDKPVFN